MCMGSKVGHYEIRSQIGSGEMAGLRPAEYTFLNPREATLLCDACQLGSAGQMVESERKEL